MVKKTGWQRFIEFWVTPKQLMVVEAGNARPAKNIHIRPITILLIPTISLMLGMLLSYQFSSSKPNNGMEIMLHQLQKQFSSMRTELVSYQAENSLKQAQIDSQKKMLAQQQNDISKLQQRIQLFNSILQARKGRHIQIIQATLQNIAPQRLFFHVTLVKGGNYPRHIRGFLQFIYRDSEGHEHHLHFQGEHEKLPYQVETHSFVQGEIHLAESIHLPQHPSIDLILLNHQGIEIMRQTCEFEK